MDFKRQSEVSNPSTSFETLSKRSRVSRTEKEAHVGNGGWRLAVIASDRIISAPRLMAPLREAMSLSGDFTQAEFAQLGFEWNENFYKELQLNFGLEFFDVQFSQSQPNNFNDSFSQIFEMEQKFKQSENPELRVFGSEFVICQRTFISALQKLMENRIANSLE